MKNKSEMSEEERQDHETHRDIIRGKLVDMLNKTSSRNAKLGYYDVLCTIKSNYQCIDEKNYNLPCSDQMWLSLTVISIAVSPFHL
jgi:hypothetical protein